ncbi:hypothetical protein [Phenylobacterium koreense]|uniref:Uncharacterized protein n=1 Tax=Phenylobacterium koreense TaxID=266125 RepID=A0ABV2EJN5_9CAUL
MSLLLLFNGGDAGPVVTTPSEITSRPFFAWGNMADTAILSGGSWTDGLPLNNLKNRKQARVARSTSLDTSATRFVIDLGSGARIWRALALVAHNISIGGRWRVTAGADAAVASPTYDSGWLAAWPSVYDSLDLEWESDNFWTGQYSEEERRGLNPTLIHRSPNLRAERYALIEIDDPFNVDSFVQIGRLFIANGWSPSSGILVGAQFGLDDGTGVQEAWGGAEVFDVKRRRRVVDIEIAPLEDREAYGKAFEMMRQAGVAGEVLFIWSGADTERAMQRQFMGRMRRLNPVQHPYPIHRSAAFNLGELF